MSLPVIVPTMTPEEEAEWVQRLNAGTLFKNGPMREPVQCSKDDCQINSWARGLCSRHYTALRRAERRSRR